VPAIEVTEVSRVFGSRRQRLRALDGVSFTASAGRTVAVLGGNGAGKTTLTKILSTLLVPSSGSARILGRDVVAEADAVRAVTSVILGGDRGLYARLTGRANLRFFAMLAGVGRRTMKDSIPETLEQVGLTETADRRVETYSKGMRQRLHIAIGVISRPEILLLDEPTVGLDPTEARRLRGAIRQMQAGGTTVLLTSHYLLDVEELADQVVLLDRGRVVADMPLAQFAAAAGYAAVVQVVLRSRPTRLAELSPEIAVTTLQTDDGRWQTTLRLPVWDAEVFRHLGTFLEESEVVDLQVRPARLEEAYERLAAR
jgi:ABC-2 type transport system ATP-binding protein